jgi:hypothetical protein
LTLAIFVKNYGIPDDWLVLLVPGALIGMWAIGLADEKWGIYKMESAFSSTINPVWSEILDNTREIKEGMKK